MSELSLNPMDWIRADLEGKAVDWVWQGFTVAFRSPLVLSQDRMLQEAVSVCIDVALVALPVVAGLHYLRHLIQVAEGNSAISAGTQVRRIAQAVLAVAGSRLLLHSLGSLSNQAVEVLGAGGLGVSLLVLTFRADAGFFLTLLLAVAFALAAFRRMILEWQAALVLVQMTFAGIGFVADDRPPYWHGLWRQVVAIAITPPLQLLVLRLLIAWVGDQSALSPWAFRALAGLYVLWKMPTWIQNSFTTGVGTAFLEGSVGAAKQVMLRYLIRRGL